jgi:hypothetical protein
MTDIQSLLEETDRLCAEATPGPWTYAHRGHHGVDSDDWPKNPRVCDAHKGRADANLIAFQRTALPQLAAEVRRLQAQLDAIEQATQRAAIEAWGHTVDFATARGMAENDEPVP